MKRILIIAVAVSLMFAATAAAKSSWSRPVAHASGLCSENVNARRDAACRKLRAFCNAHLAPCITGGSWPVINFQRMTGLYTYEYEGKYANLLSPRDGAFYTWACVRVTQNPRESPYVSWARDAQRCP
jgi:hypothetical protein